MKKHLYSYLLILALLLSVSGQRAALEKTGTPVERLREHVEHLASDRLEGRRTGEAGANAAAAYISSAFARFKLKPAATGRNGKPTYMQPFPYITGVELAPTGNEFALELTSTSGERVRVAALLPVSPVGFSPNGTGSTVPVVFAGYGITASDPKHDDYAIGGAPVDVKNKVALVMDGTPDSDNPHGAFGRFDVRTKALIAKENGAAALLVISREEFFENERLTHLSYDQTLGEAAIPTFVISRNTARRVLGVMDLDGLTVRSGDQAEQVNRDIKPTMSFKVNLVKKHADAYNVVGILDGTDPSLKDEAIVIGAHYDHLGRGGQGSLAANSKEIHHGADDNASGTAAMLELARQFASERSNRRTIIFIAFSGEEEGLLGSKYYVNDPLFPIDRTVAMINLDMVGRLNENKLNVGGIGTATELRAMVEARNVNQAAIIPVATQTPSNIKTAVPPLNIFNLALNDDGFGPSDHSSFYGKKIPVLFFFTGTHTDYHKPTDTAEKINYEGLDQVRGFVANILRDIDQSTTRPTYTVAKSSGMGGGRTGFSVSLGTIPSYADATDGLVLDGVRDGSPAAASGLKAGDKIVKLAGRDIRNVMDYTYTLGEMKAGEEYEIVILRGNERLTLKIVPAKSARSVR